MVMDFVNFLKNYDYEISIKNIQKKRGPIPTWFFHIKCLS
jgi:hypothetical protein